MKLLFLYGMPASGKYTVAKEVAEQTGYKLFHNHLVVDMLLSVFQFGDQPFRLLRERIWLDVFQQACQGGVEGVIFTFAPESTVSEGFIAEVQGLMAACGSEVLFVKLVCRNEVLLQRMVEPSRAASGKITSVEEFERLRLCGAFEDSHMPQPQLTIATDVTAPAQAAESISALLSQGQQK